MSEEVIQSTLCAKMPTAEDFSMFVTRHKYDSTQSERSEGDKGTPLEFACINMDGDEFKLYWALWRCDSGIGRHSEIGTRFKWTESKISRVVSRLCTNGFAYRITAPEGYGRTSNQLWAISFAEQIPEGFRRTDNLRFTDLPEGIRHHFKGRILESMRGKSAWYESKGSRKTDETEGWYLRIERFGSVFNCHFPNWRFGGKRKSHAAANAALKEASKLIEGAVLADGELPASTINEVERLLGAAVAYPESGGKLACFGALAEAPSSEPTQEVKIGA